MLKEKIVVDTDIFIDLLRGQQDAKLFFKRIENNEFDAYASVITEAELYSGETSNMPSEQAKIDALLNLFKVVDSLK